MKIAKIIRWAAPVALIGLAAWYVSRHRDDLGRLRDFQLAYLLPLIAVHLTALGLNGWMNRELLARLGVGLSFAQWYGLSTINALGNYLPLPQAGAMVRGAFLKRLHGLGYRRYAATILFSYVLSLVLAGLSGLVALSYLRYHGVHASWFMWAAFTGLTCVCVLLSPRAARLLPGERLKQVSEGYRSLGRPVVVAKLVAAKLMLMTVNATGFWLAYHSIGRPIGWTSSLVVTLSLMASGVVNLTPGNTGAAEAAAWGAALGIGGDGGAAVIAALIYRMTSAAVVFTLGPMFLAVLTRGAAVEKEELTVPGDEPVAG